MSFLVSHPSSSDLVARWRFDEANENDGCYCDQGYHGAAVGTPDVQVGMADGARGPFDGPVPYGTEATYFVVPHNSAYCLQYFTLALWVNLRSLPLPNYGVVVQKEYTPGLLNQSWAIRADVTNNLWALLYASDGTGLGVQWASGSLSTGWHHIGFTYNGTTLEYFVDGVSLGTDGPWAKAIAYDTEALIIGNDTDYEEQFCDCWVDDLVIYNTIKTDTWFEQAYAQTNIDVAAAAAARRTRVLGPGWYVNTDGDNEADDTGDIRRDPTDIISRANIRLRVQRGTWLGDVELGSRLHLIQTTSAARHELPDVIREALQPMIDDGSLVDVQIGQIEVSERDGKAAVEVGLVLANQDVLPLGLIPFGGS